MSLRGLLVLLVLLVAVLSVVLWVDRPKEDEKKEGSPSFLAFPVLDATAVELDHPGTKVRLEKTGEHRWDFTAPHRREADPRAIEEMLRVLRDAKVVKVIEEKASDETGFGLDPPEATVRIVTVKGAPPETIRIGRASPVSTERYASAGGGRVVLVEASVASAVLRPPRELEERRLFPVNAEAIRQIRLERREGRLALAREGDDWKMLEPLQDRADSGAADSISRSLASLEISRREVADPAASPLLSAEVETKDGATRRVELTSGRGAEGPFGRRADGTLAGPIAEAPMKELTRDASELRDKRVLVLPAQDVREARIEAGGTVVRAFRDKEDGPWKIEEKGGAPIPADDRKVDAFLDRIRWARVETFETGPAPKPDHVVVVKSADREIGRLELGPAAPSSPTSSGTTTAKRIYVRSSFRPFVLMTIAEEALAPVPGKESDLAPDPAAGVEKETGDASGSKGENAP